jgi:polysaccharide biosynthesis protein PslH
LRILWTTPYLPWPTVGGNKVRQFQLLRCLAERGHRITMLAQSKRALDAPTRAQLEPLLERLIVSDRRARSHWLTLGAVAFSPYPAVVSVNGLSRSLQRAMAELLTQSWDAVHVEHSYGLQSVLPALKKHRQPFVLTEHNVESSLVPATDYHPRLPSLARPLLRQYDSWRYRWWEKRALRAATRVIAVTPQDASVLAQISGRPVACIGNGVDTRSFAAVQPAATSRRVMFIGNYEYQPNAAAVEWALQDIMPRVWQQVPDASFLVCGHGMPSSWRERWSDPRIEFRGFVEDVRTEQSRSGILLAPLKSGGGSKLKVIEAMAAGLAVVCTPEGVSGLAVQNGREYYDGTTTEELASRLVELLRNPERVRTLGESARAYVRKSHDWRMLAEQLEAIYGELPQPRVFAAEEPA